MTSVADLIERAREVAAGRYDSPAFKLWRKDAREFVAAEYGDDYVKLLDEVLRFKRVVSPINPGAPMHRDRMDRAVEFLSELSERTPTETPRPIAPGLDGLHPAIVTACSTLFAQEHYAEAVEKASKVVRARLRALTGYETGSDAFGRGDLFIGGAAAPHVERDFNEGVKFLTMAIDRFRNEKSHTAEGNVDDAQHAFEYLATTSLAMRFLDRAEVRRRE